MLGEFLVLKLSLPHFLFINAVLYLAQRQKVKSYECFFETGDLLEAIKQDFGPFEKFKERFTTATVAIQGSGWGWLVSIT